MGNVTKENSSEKWCLWFFLFNIGQPMIYTWAAPGYELAAIAFLSLGKLIFIQCIAEMRQKFPWIRIWPLYGVTGGHIVIAISSFYLIKDSLKIFLFAICPICAIAIVTCMFLTIDRGLMPRNTTSSEDSEVVLTHNDGMKAISV